MVCQVLIHPRVPIISCGNFLQEQETVDMPNNSLANNAHVNNLQKHVEMNVDDDQSFGIENNALVAEKNSHDTSTSLILNNEQSSATINSLTKDKNISESPKETQADTPELAEESGQRDPAVHEIPDEAVRENEDNIKRTLPEEFEEVTHKMSTTGEVPLVDVSDPIPPEKRRKTQNERTSYTGGNVLNNNDRNEGKTEIFEEKKLESGEVILHKVKTVFDNYVMNIFLG